MSYGAPDFTQKADVNIVGQTVTVEIKIVGTDITLPVDIKAQTISELKIDIAGQSLGNLKVDIAAQSVSVLNINISSTDINIPVDVVAQSIGNIKIDIAAQSVGNLDVNIAGSSITIDIDIAAQSVGVSIQSEWQVEMGNLKNLFGSIDPLSADSGGYVINYSVPSGKKLYIYTIAVTQTPPAAGNPLVNVAFNLNIAGNSIARLTLTPENATKQINFMAPLRVDGGSTIYIYAYNCDTANDVYVSANITGYEI